MGMWKYNYFLDLIKVRNGDRINFSKTSFCVTIDRNPPLEEFVQDICVG